MQATPWLPSLDQMCIALKMFMAFGGEQRPQFMTEPLRNEL